MHYMLRIRQIQVEHAAWTNMLHRCYNKKHPQYKNYGGRGILVAKTWHDFEMFLADIGKKPIPLDKSRKSEYSLDRINNNIGYSPTNCRWATRTQQQANMTITRKYTAHGLTMSLREWQIYLNLARGVLESRLQVGRPINEIFVKAGEYKRKVRTKGVTGPKLNKLKAHEIRNSDKTATELAIEYGVLTNSIYNIWNNHTWKIK